MYKENEVSGWSGRYLAAVLFGSSFATNSPTSPNLVPFPPNSLIPKLPSSSFERLNFFNFLFYKNGVNNAVNNTTQGELIVELVKRDTDIYIYRVSSGH